MSALSTVASLKEGADAMLIKASVLKNRIAAYQAACDEHDRLLRYAVGEVSSVHISIKGKADGGRQTTQGTFQAVDRDHDQMIKIVLDRLRKRCTDLYEEIQQLKEQL
jgi:hypothetical protein